MSVKALQDFTFTSKYSRYQTELKRRETYKEAVQRSRQMMLDKYFDVPDVHEYINQAYDAAELKKVIGSQRALQFAGKPAFKHFSRIYNCCGSQIDRLRFFQECMYLLLCGCGTGFSVQKHHIAKLPKLVSKKSGKKKFVIPDTIEGWSDATGILVSSYFEDSLWDEYTGKEIEFDYSEIRPAGSYLSSSSGKAPGPEKLKRSLEHIKALLDKCLVNQKFRTIDAYDIVMHLANAVVSGGIRRSATICLFSQDDEDMLSAKTGDWFYTNPQRGRSNNSVVLLRNSTSYEEFKKIVQRTKEFGEPGFVWVDNLEFCANPCQPKSAPIIIKGKGLLTFGELKEGDEIWSETGWTKVVKKWSTGVKEVYKYTTDKFCNEMNTNCYFLGTRTHKIVQNKEKTEVYQATHIDCFQDTWVDTRYLTNCDDFTIARNTYSEPGKIIKTEYIGNEEVFDITVDNEPHTYWTGGCNVSNCLEIGFWPYLIVDEDKFRKFEEDNAGYTKIDAIPSTIGLASGWQMCNLSSLNCKKIKTEDDFYKACENAAIIGTLQAGFNVFPYLGEVSSKIIQRESLLGVSMTGMMEAPDIVLNPDIQRKGAKIVKQTNKKIAALIGINPAARTTCVKPEGSSSCMLGTSSGIHPHHAKRYIRRVQVNKLDNVYQHFKKYNDIACEGSVWSENKTDDVIAFCIEVPDGAKIKNQVSALSLLEQVKSTQQNWVIPGTNKDLCTQPWLNHNVSNTVNVKPEEWDDVIKFIYDNRKYLCGVSLLSITGDKDYQQAPFTAVYLPSEISKHYGDGSMFVSGLIDKALELFDDNLWLACDTLLGVKTLDGKAKIKWVERCKKFADRYFGSNLKKLTYCMKDVYNWKLWLDLNREYKDVDYTTLIEEEDNTNMTGESACAGGACEV